MSPLISTSPLGALRPLGGQGPQLGHGTAAFRDQHGFPSARHLSMSARQRALKSDALMVCTSTLYDHGDVHGHRIILV
jgi:hypothetical protein